MCIVHACVNNKQKSMKIAARRKRRAAEVVKCESTNVKVFFNDALNTLYLRFYGVGHIAKEERQDIFYLTMNSTCLFTVIWQRTIQRARKRKPAAATTWLQFPISSICFLYVPSHRQDSTYHGLCYTILGALAGTRHSSMGPP